MHQWKQRDGPFVSVPLIPNSQNCEQGDGNKRTVPVTHITTALQSTAPLWEPLDIGDYFLYHEKA